MPLPKFNVGDYVYSIDDDNHSLMRIEGRDVDTLVEPVYICEWDTRDRAGEEENTFLESQLVSTLKSWAFVRNRGIIEATLVEINNDLTVIAQMIDANDPSLTSGLIRAQRQRLIEVRALLNEL